MSVLICDKERLAFSINFFLDVTDRTRSIFKNLTSMNLRNGSFLKPYNKLAVRVLLGIKHLGYRLVSIYLIKYSCSFIKSVLQTRYKHYNIMLVYQIKIGCERFICMAYQIHSSNCSSLPKILKIYISCFT